MPQVQYLQARTERHLEQILELQRSNTETTLGTDAARSQGFVTVRHDLDLLREMNSPDRHIIAIHEQRVVAYALVMQPRFENRLPIIQPLFDQLRTLSYQGRAFEDCRYFVMGQVCVAKAFRGQGVFAGLYRQMSHCYATAYDLVVTEVADRNKRSIRAHEKVGFGVIHQYADPSGERWQLIAWDWR
jgi:GNAT superfamily N-acetyltransferase